MKFATYILLFVSSLCLGQEPYRMELKNSPDSVKSGDLFTMGLAITNEGTAPAELRLRISCTAETEMITPPSTWTQLGMSQKLQLLKFRILEQGQPGPQMVLFQLVSGNRIVLEQQMRFVIQEVRSFSLSPVGGEQFVFPGDTARSYFQLINTGNVSQTFTLSSNGELLSKEQRLGPGESTWVEANRVVEKHWKQGPHMAIELRVSNVQEEKFQRSTVPVYSSSNLGDDPYKRLPSTFSLYYNHYKNSVDEQVNLSAELKGSGQWGEGNKHRIQYLLRVPNHNNRSRFGLNDQYTVIYELADKLRVALGDQSPPMSRLAFGGRNGIGAHVRYTPNRWSVEAFYIQPRLDQFFTAPVTGAGVSYRVGLPITIGVNQYVSQAVLPSLELTDSYVGVSTFQMIYSTNRLSLTAELGRSDSEYGVDYSGQFSGNYRRGAWSWSGNGILAGPQYLGVINNSTQVSNTLSYQGEKWTLGASQSFSELNETIDTLFQGVQPYFENYALFVNRRINQGTQLRLRSFYTEREDRQSTDPLFHYLEQGLDYRFLLKGNKYAINFTGRVAETENLLVEGFQRRRTTLGHHLSSNVFIGRHLNLMGHVNHNYTNRYSREGRNLNYINYGFGFQLMRIYNHSLGFNYNSGFSPEETYRQRDFLSAVLQLNPSMKHRLSARLNWFAYPNRGQEREWFGNVKYSYQFGIPVEKEFDPYQLSGKITMNGEAVAGVSLFCEGLQVQSQRDGSFTFKNLSVSEVMLVVNQSTLPLGWIVDYSQPLTVSLNQGKVGNYIEINLVEQAVVRGTVVLPATIRDLNVKGSIVELSNGEDKFYAQADARGQFRFDELRPGSYSYKVIYVPDNNKEYVWALNQGTLDINAAEEKVITLKMRQSNRDIRFDGNTLKLKRP